MASGLPVIPVAMIGTDRVLAPGHTVPSLHRVGIRVGEPLTFEQYRDHRPAALAAIYPGRRVRAFLVWVEGPGVVELAPGMLNEALGRLPAAP